MVQPPKSAAPERRRDGVGANLTVKVPAMTGPLNLPKSAELPQPQIEHVLRTIRAAFPQFASAPAQFVNRGDDHVVVVFGGKTIFRVPRSDAYRRSFKDELKLLAVLKETTRVAIPRYVYVSEKSDFGGYELIAGEEMTVERFAALTAAQQHHVIGEVANFMTALHKLNRDVLAVYRAKEPWSGRDLGQYKERYWHTRRDIIAPHVEPEILKNIDDFFDPFLQACQDVPAACVVHGDLSDDHVLLDVRQGHVAGIIDFGDAAIGDPATDFCFFWSYGDWVARELYGQYGLRNDATLLERSQWHYLRYMIDKLFYDLRQTVPYRQSIAQVALQQKLPMLLARA
jgi:aminoglycoside 2''-phosphotransferase